MNAGQTTTAASTGKEHRDARNVSGDTLPNLELLPPVFGRYPDIEAVYLFGSIATNRFGPLSDIDLAIYPNAPDVRDKHLDLLTDLARVGFCDTDLVYLDIDDIVLKFEAVRCNRIIYQTAGFDSGSYYSKILRQYFDFLPYLRYQRKAYKERILNS